MGFNLALIFLVPLIWYSSVYGKNLAGTGVNTWQVTLNYLMSLVIVAGVTIVACYWWMNRQVLTDKGFYNPEKNWPKAKKAKHKMGVIEGLVYLSKSKYLLCLALLVIGYGMSTGIFTIVMTFVGGISFVTGLGAKRLVLPHSTLYHWYWLFFLIVFRDYMIGYITFIGTTPVMMAVIIGMVQNIASKSTK